jgi:hypothetical protein
MERAFSSHLNLHTVFGLNSSRSDPNLAASDLW